MVFLVNDNTDNVARQSYGEADRSSESEIRTPCRDGGERKDNKDNLRQLFFNQHKAKTHSHTAGEKII